MAINVGFSLYCENCGNADDIDEKFNVKYAGKFCGLDKNFIKLWGLKEDFIQEMPGWRPAGKKWHFCSQQCYDEAMGGNE